MEETEGTKEERRRKICIHVHTNLPVGNPPGLEEPGLPPWPGVVVEVVCDALEREEDAVVFKACVVVGVGVAKEL